MSIYDDLQDVTTEVLSEFKQETVQLVKITPGTGPADNPGTPSEVVTDLQAVVRGASYKYQKEGFCVAGDLEMTCAVVPGVTVTINDFIIVDGKRFKILSDISVPASGTRVAWKFLLRRGG